MNVSSLTFLPFFHRPSLHLLHLQRFDKLVSKMSYLAAMMSKHGTKLMPSTRLALQFNPFNIKNRHSAKSFTTSAVQQAKSLYRSPQHNLNQPTFLGKPNISHLHLTANTTVSTSIHPPARLRILRNRTHLHTVLHRSTQHIQLLLQDMLRQVPGDGIIGMCGRHVQS